MGAPPTLHTFVASEVVTAANLNLLRDGVNWLIGSKPDFRAHATTTQTVVTGTWTTITTLDTVDLDTESGWASSAYTCKVAGYYLLQGAVVFAPNATGGRYCRFTVNGSAIRPPNLSHANNSILSGTPTSIMYHLAVNDVVRLQGFQTSGGNLATAANYASGAAEASYFDIALLRT